MTSRGPVPDPDPFEHDDAAYLLGALDGAELAAFEEHLAGCAACSARVAALRPAVGALAAAGHAGRDVLAESLRVSADPDGEPAKPASVRPRPHGPDPDAETTPDAGAAGTGPDLPDDRMVELVRLVERRRRRTRWVIGGLATAAAAVLAALIVTLALPSSAPADTAVAQHMTPVGAVAIRATAAISAVPWGSEITVRCSYDEPSPYASTDAYALQVVDRAGRSHQLGSWTLTGSAQVRFTSGTALPPDQIRAVNVLRPDGTVILQLAE